MAFMISSIATWLKGQSLRGVPLIFTTSSPKATLSFMLFHTVVISKRSFLGKMLTFHNFGEGVSKAKKRPQYKSKLATLVKYT